jgi:hypothetical protein
MSSNSRHLRIRAALHLWRLALRKVKRLSRRLITELVGFRGKKNPLWGIVVRMMPVAAAVRSWHQSNKEGASDVESDQGTYVKLQELTRQKIKVGSRETNRWIECEKCTLRSSIRMPLAAGMENANM